MNAVNQSNLRPIWTVPTGSEIVSSPAIASGNVVVGSTNGDVMAFSMLNGTKEWKYNTGGAILSSPSTDNGTIFIGSDDSFVYAIDASNGTMLWDFNTSAPVISSPAVNGSLVVVGSDDGHVYFLNESTGDFVWDFATGGAVESPPTILNGIAYVGSNDSSVYALNLTSRQLVWQFSANSSIIGGIAVDSNVGYFDTVGGYLFAVNLTNGSMIWRTDIGPSVSSPALADAVTESLMPITYLPALYTATLDGRLLELARANGSVIWSRNLGAPIYASPAIGYTKLYIGNSNGTMYHLGRFKRGEAIGTFDSQGNLQTTFGPNDSVTIGVNAAWGQYGVNKSLVTVRNPLGKKVITNASLTFVTGIGEYNFVYNFTLANGMPGLYKVTLFSEDAGSKLNSHHSRVSGWVVTPSNFTVT